MRHWHVASFWPVLLTTSSIVYAYHKASIYYLIPLNKVCKSEGQLINNNCIQNATEISSHSCL